MGIRRTEESNGKRIVIHVAGRFDFSQQRAFRDAYREVSDRQIDYVVDLKATSYVDSAALGMLLLLREHAGGDKARVGIQGCSPDVRRVLDIANFGRLFKLS
jgi:anti-anti-sigma factor